jgi:hypothetical protein
MIGDNDRRTRVRLSVGRRFQLSLGFGFSDSLCSFDHDSFGSEVRRRRNQSISFNLTA